MKNTITIAPDDCCLKTAAGAVWPVPHQMPGLECNDGKRLLHDREIASVLSRLDTIGLEVARISTYRDQFHLSQIPIDSTHTPRFPPLGII